MADKIDIINLALRRIGELPIESIDEGSAAADVMKDIYDMIVDSELRSWPYTWAVKTDELAQVASEEAPDFGYIFQLPADYLKMVTIIDPSTGSTLWDWDWPSYNRISRTQYEWEVRQDKLYVNFSEVTIKYIFDQSDESKWDPSFVDAIAWRLAMEASISITDSDRITERAREQYFAIIRMARGSNGAESRRKFDLSREYRKARY
jgi:hypothetical protein